MKYATESSLTEQGFSLVEMAVVLVVVGLILGAIVVPLSAQMDQRHHTETRQRMNEIKEALIGFVILNGRFPCPSVETDPAKEAFGVEAASCKSSLTGEGYLPWKTLGVYDTDAWGVVQASAAGNMAGYWRYRIDGNFSVPFDLAGKCQDNLQVRDSHGNLLMASAGDAERAVAIIYSTGKNRKPDGENASYESKDALYQSDVQSPGFDDQLIWIGRPFLMHRMVAAGKLP